MKKTALLISTLLMAISAATAKAADTGGDILTPERLWSMGRIGGACATSDGSKIAYTVTTYDIAANKGHTAIYLSDLKQKTTSKLTADGGASETDAAFIAGDSKIAFLAAKDGVTQLWTMNADGSGKQCVSSEKDDIEGFLFSPDGKRVVIIHEVPTETSIAKNDDDLPKATGMLISDLMYKHWDQYVKTIPHPFIADFSAGKVSGAKDLLAGQPYECPMMPFGGMEEFAWSPDSKQLAYVLRKKTGRDYAVSTDSDILLYDLESGTTRNLCKGDKESPSQKADDYTRSLKDQRNYDGDDLNLGYDDSPKFSPDGKRIAWTSMKRDGYESDRARLCVYELATGKKTYVTESFDSGVDNYCWKIGRAHV